MRGSLPWWSEDSCRTDHVCEFVNRFPADRRKVEVSLFFVVFETACGFMGRAHRYLLPPPLRTKTVTIRFFSFGLKKNDWSIWSWVCFVPKFNKDSLLVVTKFRSPNRSPNF